MAKHLSFITIAIISLFSHSLHALLTNPFDDCFYVQSTVCVNSQKAVIGKDNRPDNLIGLWTFDDKYAADHSGFKNFLDPPPKVGPAAGGRGYSAHFNGTDMSIIPHIPTYERSEFTLTFWVFLLKTANQGGWKSLIYKGNNENEMTPTILLWPDDTRLHVRVSTDKGKTDGLDSVGAIPLRKWTHVAVSYSNQLLQLYLNGQLDNQVILQGNLVVNKGPFHLGRDPYHAGTPCFIDSLKFYEGKLRESYLMADSSGPLYVAEGDYYSVVGCESCNYNQALNSCDDGYHLCSLPELYGGAYHNARTLGWFRNNKNIWYRVTSETQDLKIAEEMLDPNVFKLGLCCVI